MGSLFSAENLQYLWNGARQDQCYYWWPIGSRTRAFIDLGWPWRAIMHSVWKHMRISELTTKIWMKIDPYCQRQSRSPMTLFSGNIRFMRILRGFPVEEASNDSGVIENVDFQGFQTLRLRHFRKWGQHYYAVLLNALLTFHWLQNTWPWMTLNGHFTLNFHYYEEPFEKLFLHTYRWACLYHVISGDERKRTVIRRIFGIRRRTADLSYRRYTVGTLTNKASISI